MSLAAFVERVIARLKQTPVDLGLLPTEAVPGSIFTGGAGIAFFLHETARMRGDEEAAALARRWCDAARTWAAAATPAQWNETPVGFVMGETGLSYVEALLAAREGNAEQVSAAVGRIERASTRILEGKRRPSEYLGGAAGIVCATRDLVARLHGPGFGEVRGPLERTRSLAIEILLDKHRAPLAPQANDFLGFAHGFAGELWALLSVVGAGHALVRARLDELAALRELDEEGLVYWLASPNAESPELLGTWCNGVAGHTLLWCEVARQTSSPESMELARQSAESVSILLSRSPTLCCGLAGHAVALQRYADVSGDARVARRAYRRLCRALPLADDDTVSTFVGLWQGALGIALVAMHRLAGESAIPCLEPLATAGAYTERP